jgi:hypothetical protein
VTRPRTVEPRGKLASKISSVEQNPSSEADNSSPSQKVPPHFIETSGALPYAQRAATFLCSEPD